MPTLRLVTMQAQPKVSASAYAWAVRKGMLGWILHIKTRDNPGESCLLCNMGLILLHHNSMLGPGNLTSAPGSFCSVSCHQLGKATWPMEAFGCDHFQCQTSPRPTTMMPQPMPTTNHYPHLQMCFGGVLYMQLLLGS
eukprot:gb/GFBE01072115.1/.p1 GENE.gb/GFBE01072115.1/~~gb/GFBE01072115.1/.p1  ORF type:complete len:138 (+),score=10.83 gb/GFBE01072115.1/:1-414(+)